MQKKFLSNLAFLVFLNLLVKPFYILRIDAEIQNQVGAEIYGNYFTLFNFSLLFNMLLDFGISNFNTRDVARRSEVTSSTISRMASLKGLLAMIYVGFTMLAALVIGFEGQQIQFLALLAFNQVLVSLILFLRSNLSGLHLFKQDSIVSVLDRLLLILICAVLLWGGVTSSIIKIEWFILAQTVAYGASAVVALLILVSKIGFPRIQFDFGSYRGIIRKSLPFAFFILLVTIYNRVDAVMLERLLDNGKESAGIYAQAFRLMDAANMFSFLFASLLLPIFSRMIGNGENVNSLLGTSFRLITIPALLVAVICYFYAPQILGLLYHEHIDTSAPVLSILMWSFVAISWTYIFGTLLTANGNLRLLNITSLCGVLLNIGLNLLVIPKYGATGAAMTSLATQVLAVTIQIIAVKKLFPIKIEASPTISFVAFVVTVVFSGFLIDAQGYLWGVSVFTITLGVGISAAVYKMVDLKAMYRHLAASRSDEGT